MCYANRIISIQVFPRMSKSTKMSSDIPTASSVTDVPVVVEGIDAHVASLKTLQTADLFKVMKHAVSEMEKRMKTSTRSVKSSRVVAKKADSMPKGEGPQQLRRPRAWVAYTLAHARENGWESFTVCQKKTDNETGEKVYEEIEMPKSILFNGTHVYDGSICEKLPTGKQLIHKDAMSLSKQRWTPKGATGTHQSLYDAFIEQYVEQPSSSQEGDTDIASVASSSKKVVIKITAAEKEAEKESKKAEKEAEKDAKKAEKDAKKAEKDAEKDAKKAEKVVVPTAAMKKVVVPAPKTVAAATTVTVVPEAVKKAGVVAKKKAVVAATEKVWSCPEDGMVHAWSYKGKSYLRNSDNETWVKGADGGCGEWQGIYLPTEDRIDDSVAEPVFDDE